MANKLTKRDYFGMILELVQGNEELEKFVNHELELLDKKSNGNRKPTATQIANIELIEVIKVTLAKINDKATITEMQEVNEKLAELSNQKMSALLKKLVDNKEVEKIVDKRKTYFKLANN